MTRAGRFSGHLQAISAADVHGGVKDVVVTGSLYIELVEMSIKLALR